MEGNEPHAGTQTPAGEAGEAAGPKSRAKTGDASQPTPPQVGRTLEIRGALVAGRLTRWLSAAPALPRESQPFGGR